MLCQPWCRSAENKLIFFCCYSHLHHSMATSAPWKRSRIVLLHQIWIQWARKSITLNQGWIVDELYSLAITVSILLFINFNWKEKPSRHWVVFEVLIRVPTSSSSLYHSSGHGEIDSLQCGIAYRFVCRNQNELHVSLGHNRRNNNISFYVRLSRGHGSKCEPKMKIMNDTIQQESLINISLLFHAFGVCMFRRIMTSLTLVWAKCVPSTTIATTRIFSV